MVSVPQDDLTDNFNWSPRAAGKGGGMSSQIMRTQIDTGQFICLFDHYASGIVRDRKNALLGIDALILDLKINSVTDVVEKGFKARIAVSFGGLFGSFGEPGQKG